MSLVDNIQSLDMKIDDKYYDTSLIDALKMYHSLIDKNIIQPRENQLNKSGTLPKIIHFNSIK